MTNLLLRLLPKPTQHPPSVAAPKPTLTRPALVPRSTTPPRSSGDCSARYAPSFSACWAYSGVVKDHVPIRVRIQKRQKKKDIPTHLPIPSLAGFAVPGNGKPIHQAVFLSIQIFSYHRTGTAIMQKLLLLSLFCPRADSLINPTLSTDPHHIHPLCQLSSLPHL